MILRLQSTSHLNKNAKHGKQNHTHKEKGKKPNNKTPHF